MADASAQAALAGVLAHDANNLIGKLYAAGSWLEDASDPQSIEETRLALADAVASARAFQAVLYLLSLTPESRRDTPVPLGLGVSAQAQLFDTLREVAQVQCPGVSGQWENLASRMDLDILRAVLVCVARLLRRQAGHRASLGLGLAPDLAGHWQLTLAASSGAGDTAETFRRPEAFALAHAAHCLAEPALDWACQRASVTQWQLGLMGSATRS